MTHANAATHTEDFRRRTAASFTDGLAATAEAAAAADWDRAIMLAGRFRDGGEHLHAAVVRDVLAAGVNWWRLGDLMSLHPQAAYERFGPYRESVEAPAEQHPELAVLVTAGLAAEHNWADEFGIDIEDLGAEHSLFADPTVVALRQAAQLLGDDIWIAVRLPGEYEGEAEAADGEVIKQWTTVVLGEDELTWLKEAFQLNAVDDVRDGEDDDLDRLE
jgi:hypothetical protein